MSSGSLPADSPGHSHRIRSISVIGGFLDGTRLKLSKGLNCIIGARGTGKSTVLEFVRFAFDSLPDRETELMEYRRVNELVEQNLGGGRVEIEFETSDGLRYRVSRSVGESPVILTGDGKATQLTLKSGDVFRADICGYCCAGYRDRGGSTRPAKRQATSVAGLSASRRPNRRVEYQSAGSCPNRRGSPHADPCYQKRTALAF